MILKSGSLERLDQFSKFTSMEEFQLHMKQWLLKHKRDFTKCELVALKWLVFYSGQILGVCNESIGTMLQAIHSEYYNHGISRASFKRMIKKASHLGIITVYETQRENGSQTANLYVFNRFVTDEPQNTFDFEI